MQTGVATVETVETVWQVLQKSKLEPPRDPAISLLGIYPKETTTITQNIYICTSMFMAALFNIARNGSNLDVYQQMNG